MTKDYGEYFNIAHIEPISHIYGPGERFVVWFQGCKLACEGCWNHDMWSFKNKLLVHKEHLLENILHSPSINGVSFLGGEPLHQSDNLWWLIRQIREHSNLTIFLFTGFEKDELSRDNHWQKIHELCDIIALGRYQKERRNTNQQWIGSNNQKIIYPEGSRESIRPQNTNQVEIIFESDGSTRILGFPDEKLKIEF